MLTIEKGDLKDGSYYINGNDGRGMWIGIWDAKKEVFQCLMYSMGHFTVYAMPYKGESPSSQVSFDPIALIELPEPIIIKKKIMTKNPWMSYEEYKAAEEHKKRANINLFEKWGLGWLLKFIKI